MPTPGARRERRVMFVALILSLVFGLWLVTRLATNGAKSSVRESEAHSTAMLATYARKLAVANRDAQVARCKTGIKDFRIPFNNAVEAERRLWGAAERVRQEEAKLAPSPALRAADLAAARQYARNRVLLKPVPIPDCEKIVPPLPGPGVAPPP